jgi:hypothetical protein
MTTIKDLIRDFMHEVKDREHQEYRDDLRDDEDILDDLMEKIKTYYD